MTVKAGVFVAMCGALAFACNAEPPGAGGDETQEIIENLVQVGYARSDVTIVDGVVYVQGDAAVSLQSSREMLGSDNSRGSKEQYRTTNLVSYAVKTICVDGSAFSGVLSTALDNVISNYNNLGLNFTMRRTAGSAAGCNAMIKVFVSALDTNVLGVSGFPTRGLPYSRIDISDVLTSGPLVTATWAITHELGHAIGMRHSDYFNRMSCNKNDPEDTSWGAILIPGTPRTAAIGASVMNACYNIGLDTGNFTSSDVVAIRALYAPLVVRQQIVWHNDSTNETQIWFMLDGQIRARLAVVDGNGSPLVLGLPWRIRAVVNGGIVWYNETTFETQIWFLNGNRLVNRVTVLDEGGRPMLIGQPWVIVGGDGNELIWHNDSSDETQVWFLAGGRITRRSSVVDEGGRVILIGSPWKIVGADEREIVWHNNGSDETQVWFLSDGMRIARRETVRDESQNVILIGRPWRIVGGHQAIVWYNDSSHETQIWFMFDGFRIGSRQGVVDEEGVPIFIAPPWNIVGSAGFSFL